jgi:uncharacterized protein YyaL (SSP411 family)
MADQKPNRLISEKSPYLLQHAHNPVDWYAWGDEAFERAKKEDKPIFLSIGYSTCHWCHVMERESFEDPDVARLMNEVFVSIKVDREERPDLDQVYMTVSQILTGSGGWPLTIIMTPDKRPFFAGTYIPKESRFGRVGMMELIPRIRKVWSGQRDGVLDSANKIIDALRIAGQERPGTDLGMEVLEKAYEELAGRFDEGHGGFGTSPKFPTPHNFLFLLRCWKRTGNEKALEMVEKSLLAMRKGGIFDHVGYGFHRYSTDRQWLLPHFEKMLYDQALLVLPYVEVFQATGHELYRKSAEEILEYVLRDMTSPDGAFYSAEDADSEGVEGKFYIWHEDEIRDVLEEDEADLFIQVYGVLKEGNFSEEARGIRSGANILHLKKSIDRLAPELNISIHDLQARLKTARDKLFDVRVKRVHPHKDDKVLTDWNGLMIAALAKAAQVFDKHEYAAAAKKAADFILERMQTSKGRLLHRFRDGEAAITANLDDYAFFVWGLMELYEAAFETRFLKTALDLNQDMLAHFLDRESGGLFFTPDDGESLLVRKKEVYDGAIPSGNSVALLNMIRLARFTGSPDLEKRAADMARAFSGQVKELPSAYTHFLLSIDFALGPAYELVIAGNPGAKDTKEMIRAVRTHFIPNRVILFRNSDKKDPEMDRLAAFTKSHVSLGGKAAAYVCVGNACKSPTTDMKEMLHLIR